MDPGPPGDSLGRVEAYVPIPARSRAIEAAKRLGIHRQLLYSRTQKYGVDPRLAVWRADD
jgi:hypothetical protein